MSNNAPPSPSRTNLESKKVQAEVKRISAAQHCLKNCPCIIAHKNTLGLIQINVKLLVLD